MYRQLWKLSCTTKFLCGYILWAQTHAKRMQIFRSFFYLMFLSSSSRVANSDWTLYIQYYTVFSEIIPRRVRGGRGWLDWSGFGVIGWDG
jgi:hypothetical protein